MMSTPTNTLSPLMIPSSSPIGSIYEVHPSQRIDALPPLPPSTSSNIPLQVNLNDGCSVRVDLDKTYFTNGGLVSGCVHLSFYQRQYLHNIQIQLGGFEKVYAQSISGEQNDIHHNAEHHTLPFFSQLFMVFPSNQLNDHLINNDQDNQNNQNNYNNGVIGGGVKPINDNNNNINNLNNYDHSNGSSPSPILSPSNNNQNNNNNSTTNYKSYKELEAGTYKFPFSIQLPTYLAPSLNYIDFLSIYYVAKCVVEFSKGKEWKENTISRTTEFFVHGIAQNYMERIENAPVIGRVSRFLWNHKSQPAEMSITLRERNLFIGERAVFSVQIRNPTSNSSSQLNVDLVQKIDLRIPHLSSSLNQSTTSPSSTNNSNPTSNINSSLNNSGATIIYSPTSLSSSSPSSSSSSSTSSSNQGSSSNVVSLSHTGLQFTKLQLVKTKMLSQSFDLKKGGGSGSQDGSGGIDTLSTRFQVTIPRLVEDDLVYPTTKGNLSTIKHYFLISIPSIKLEIKLPFTLWSKGNQSQTLQSLQDSGGNNSGISNLSIKNSQKLSISSSNSIPPPIDWMPQWKNEDKETNCNLCEDPFSLINRMHHCRSCGGVFCGKCTVQKIPLKKYGLKEPVRICAVCHEMIRDAETKDTNSFSTNPSIKRYSPHLLDI